MNKLASFTRIQSRWEPTLQWGHNINHLQGGLLYDIGSGLSDRRILHTLECYGPILKYHAPDIGLLHRPELVHDRLFDCTGQADVDGGLKSGCEFASLHFSHYPG